MRYIRKCLAPGALALFVLLVAGCGGGGSGVAPALSAADTSRGAASVSLQFAGAPAGRKAMLTRQASGAPGHTRAFAGNIPFGARSVRVTVTNPSTGAELAPPRIVISPSTIDGLKPLVTVQYASLPVGPVRVDVAAFPNHDGSGNALATGSASGQVSALQTTTLSAPMVMTITRLTVNPTQIVLQLDSSNTGTLTVTGVNASGQPLDLPYMFVSADPDIAEVMVSTQDNTTATILPRRPGTTQVTVYEPNSELTATARVLIQ